MMADTAARPCDSERETMWTAQDAAARDRETWSPMPEAPPRMRAVRPVREGGERGEGR